MLAGGLGLSASALAAQEPPGHRQYDAYGTEQAPPNKSQARLADEAAELARREEACDQGVTAACGELGEAYERGIGTSQNRPIAAILYTEACDAGDAQSCMRLGRITSVAREDDAAQVARAALERACTLGSLEGCALLARIYSRAGDHEGADLLGRETCARGGGIACLDLAWELRNSDADDARPDEYVALLVSACKGGSDVGCKDLAYETRYRADRAPVPPLGDTLARGCALEDAFACKELGDLVMGSEGGARDTDTALSYYDRACYLDPTLCWEAENVRAEPVEYAACQNDDNSACARLAMLYSIANSALYDPDLSTAYFEYACYAGATEACAQAGRRVLDAADKAEASEIAPDRITQALAYLERGCAADEMSACWLLTEEMVEGKTIPHDIARIYTLKWRLCENGWYKACDDLERAGEADPNIPLIEAGPRYLPPVEEGDTTWDDEYLTEDEREANRTRCADSEIEFRGQTYRDQICVSRQMVIGGKALRPGAAPWQALLWRPERGFGRNLSAQDRVLCGGSLIATGWILTAAHCVRDDGGWITGRGYTVRLGVSNPRMVDEGTSYPITHIYRHPSYDPGTYAFDIALVRYNPRAGRRGATSYGIARIALDDKPVTARANSAGQPVYIFGWGWTRASAGTSTSQLRGAKLLLSSDASCNRVTGFGLAAWNSMLCAAGANAENACKGDSGGPLITYGDADRKPRVIGVVSSGRACGQAGEASRYVRVAAARDWIDRVMGR